eukprot:RCo047648
MRGVQSHPLARPVLDPVRDGLLAGAAGVGRATGVGRIYPTHPHRAEDHVHQLHLQRSPRSEGAGLPAPLLLPRGPAAHSELHHRELRPPHLLFLLLHLPVALACSGLGLPCPEPAAPGPALPAVGVLLALPTATSLTRGEATHTPCRLGATPSGPAARGGWHLAAPLLPLPHGCAARGGIAALSLHRVWLLWGLLRLLAGVQPSVLATVGHPNSNGSRVPKAAQRVPHILLFLRSSAGFGSGGGAGSRRRGVDLEAPPAGALRRLCGPTRGADANAARTSTQLADRGPAAASPSSPHLPPLACLPLPLFWTKS